MAGFESVIVVRVLDAPVVLYRACHGPDRTAVQRALSSNYEIRREPPHPADLHATVLHMAVSMFDRASTIARLARRRPERVGTHIARLELRPGHGLCIADTGSRGHWSIWGIPAQLLMCVTDVEEVQ